MSYDLYFKCRDPKSTPSVDEVGAYFKQRNNYEVTDKQAIYQNQITGVYFMFYFGEEPAEGLTGMLPVVFNLNYYRPHIFGLEAELELKAFVEAFGLQVFDPQTDGMGEGEYSSRGFLAGWNKGNEFGYKAILQQNPDQAPLSLSTSQIEDCWRWNFAVSELQQTLGENVFVPRYMFILYEGKVARTVVWPDGIPSAIPEADIVFIPRKNILPKSFFRAAAEDKALVPWNDLKAFFAQFPLKQGAVPYHLMTYIQTPASVVSLVRGLEPSSEKPVGLSVDNILNSELVEKVRIK